MKKTIFNVVFLLLAVTAFSQTNPDAIIGEWLSPKKDSRVLIYKQGAKYFGHITWGTGTEHYDVKNPKPDLRKRELIGLTILKDFEFDGDNTWKEGSIYDPREGKIYFCKITLKDAGQINIRGYVGFSLFGRTETWTKFN